MGRKQTVKPEDRSPELQRYYANRQRISDENNKRQASYRSDLEKYRRSRFQQVKGRAKAKGIEFSLTYEWLERQPHKCAVTGVDFVVLPTGKGPLTMAFDRIDPKKGYTPDNCQLVACWYNQAKGEWPEEQVQALIRAFPK